MSRRNPPQFLNGPSRASSDRSLRVEEVRCGRRRLGVGSGPDWLIVLQERFTERRDRLGTRCVRQRTPVRFRGGGEARGLNFALNRQNMQIEKSSHRRRQRCVRREVVDSDVIVLKRFIARSNNIYLSIARKHRRVVKLYFYIITHMYIHTPFFRRVYVIISWLL